METEVRAVCCGAATRRGVCEAAHRVKAKNNAMQCDATATRDLRGDVSWKSAGVVAIGQRDAIRAAPFVPQLTAV